MKSEERIWQLLVKRENGDITPEELSELEHELRNNDPVGATNALLAEIMKKGIIVEEQPLNVETSWKAIKERIIQHGPRQERRIWLIYRRLAVAAAIILIAGTAGLYFYTRPVNEKTALAKANSNQVSTPLGSKSKIVLPDGTRVWLNAGSRISYNDFGNASVREVSLSGEAYFDVVHNGSKPFVVHTSAIDIRDVGTVFVVKAYPDDKKIETTLIEGSIEVTDHHNILRKILLKPSNKLTISFGDSLKEGKAGNARANGLSMPYRIDKVEKDAHGLLSETAWTQNKLVFNNEPFGQLAEKMQRWYNVSFHFEDTLIRQTPFSGIIENETLEQSLQAMQFSTAFKYRLQGSDVRISKK